MAGKTVSSSSPQFVVGDGGSQLDGAVGVNQFMSNGTACEGEVFDSPEGVDSV